MSSTEFRKERCSYLTFLFLTLESGRFWFIVLGDLNHCFWIFLTRFILFTTLLNVYSRQNEITCKLNRRQLRQDSELCQNDARSIDVEKFSSHQKKNPGFNFLIRKGQLANLHGAVLATVWSCIIMPVILQFIILSYPICLLPIC